jgi:hypothetical protein
MPRLFVISPIETLPVGASESANLVAFPFSKLSNRGKVGVSGRASFQHRPLRAKRGGLK